MPHVLVAGASGLVGHAAIKHFASLPGWKVTGLSRRPPAPIEGVSFISADLLDADATRAAMDPLHDVTHLVYAALQEIPGLLPGWTDQVVIDRNAAMLRNLFEPLSTAARGLEHVSLLHGTKAYGLHHPSIGTTGIRVPLREREPRREHPNFYFVQEDYLHEKQRGAGWGMTVFRPTVIYGDAPGNNMNPIFPIAAYAAILRERERALDFPGAAGEPVIREAVDARLVARALAWAATDSRSNGGTFNITNGDVFLWENVWPAIAAALGMEPGEPRPTILSDFLPQHEADWAAIVRKYELDAPESIVEYVGYNSLIYTDLMLSGAHRQSLPILNSTISLRQAGFCDCIDTEDMFSEIFAGLRSGARFPR